MYVERKHFIQGLVSYDVEAAEAKLDEYALAMEDGMGVQLQMTSAVTKKGK